jgi:uncharacterized surface protein with fasciclin (FAS1) repeats
VKRYFFRVETRASPARCLKKVGINPMALLKMTIHLNHPRMGTGSDPPTKQHIMKTKKLTRTVLLISMAALIPAVFAQSDKAVITVTEEKNAAVKTGSLTTVIADSATFSTLTKALKAAGLDATLGDKDEFTVFAPTDEAFGKLPAETLTKLMLPENKEKLRMLLLYHVVAGRMIAADLISGDVKTVNGEKLKIDVSADKIEVDGEKVFSADVIATNGVMHSIGKVLVPKSLDGFAGLKQ